MFVILLSYVRPLDQVDALMKEHVEFLKRYYAEGKFLLSGRRVPRIGGVILCASESVEEVEEIMREDPFTASGVATYELIEFNASMTIKELAHLQKWPQRSR